MPNLKRNMKGSPKTRAQGLGNFAKVMERRERERAEETTMTLSTPPIVAKSEPVEEISVFFTDDGEKLYANVFAKIGPRIRKNYMTGELPRVHKALFDALKEEENRFVLSLRKT